MALWIFRRRSQRKRSHSEAEGPASQQRPPARSQTVADAVAAPLPTTLKKRRTEPNKLQRRARASSYSPGRGDSISVPKRKRATVPPPLPTSAGSGAEGSNPDFATAAAASGRDDAEMAGALGDDVYRRVPTLHNKPSGGQLKTARKSSKRRREDQDREAELRAISKTNFTPLRPATDDWNAGRPIKKDIKRAKTMFGGRWHNPSSDVSLPTAGSIHSSLSSDSDHAAYKVSPLNALAPRPTLRYSSFPRWAPSSGSGPARAVSGKRKLSEPIPEATLRAHKRIDDLADDFDASDLREVMERDNRRREKRRLRDQEKMDRRLARRAEKQREVEAAAAESGDEPPTNLERGALGRELIGLGIEPASAVVSNSVHRRPSDATNENVDDSAAPADDEDEEGPGTATPRPFKTSRSSSISPEIPLAVKKPDTPTEPAVAGSASEPAPAVAPAAVQLVEPPSEPVAEPIRESVVPELLPSPRQKGLLRKKSRSKSTIQSDMSRSNASPATGRNSSLADKVRKVSDGSKSKASISWSMLFKWATKNNRGSEPSSFSNTSRDSMPPALLQLPPQPQVVNYVPPRKMSSGVPKRTMSRFREDLPELPLSPPDSRVQSPDVEPPVPTLPENLGTPAVHQRAMRNDTPTSDEVMRQTPQSWRPDDEPAPSPEPPSISLASIDSEASWLSGRLAAKRSIGMRDRYHRRNMSGVSDDNTTTNTDEDYGIGDDDYLDRLTPAPYGGGASGSASNANRLSTGDARPSSDEDGARSGGPAKWGAVGKQPTMVHAAAVNMMKSREGLVNYDYDRRDEDLGEDDTGTDTNDNSPVDADAGIHRATSVNLGRGHARHISAGSAKLLQLTPRASVDNKRRSLVEPTS